MAPLKNVRIVSAGIVDGLVPHCEVLGAIDDRIGVDDQPYAINFRLRVPVSPHWNGRFLFSGGGGTNGNVGDARSAVGIPFSAIDAGYAVVSQDSGHDNDKNNIPARSGTRAFNFDPRARQDWGYRSHGRVTTISKVIIEHLTGRNPDTSYYAGCSEGGREAIMMSQRYPEQFDGLLAGAPALSLPLVTPLSAWMAQTFGDLAKSQGHIDRNGLPFINKSFTDEDLDVLTTGISVACDRLDGATDGMSQNFRGCAASFDPAMLICSENIRTDCLSADQVRALTRQMEGPRRSDGTVLNRSWPWDLGMVSGQLRGSWIGPFDARQASSVLISNSWATGHLTPPPVFDMTQENGAAVLRYLLAFDFDKDWDAMFATTEKYTEATWDLTFATGTDLDLFHDKGGKLVIWHGVSDGPFNPNETAQWWDDLRSVYGDAIDDFVRVYFVPGMGHCGGGPSTSQFDLFTALVDWVESDKSPHNVTATAVDGTPWPGRTRPLCPYPEYAHYKGSGSIELAENFVCTGGHNRE